MRCNSWTWRRGINRAKVSWIGSTNATQKFLKWICCVMIYVVDSCRFKLLEKPREFTIFDISKNLKKISLVTKLTRLFYRFFVGHWLERNEFKVVLCWQQTKIHLKTKKKKCMPWSKRIKCVPKPYYLTH